MPEDWLHGKQSGSSSDYPVYPSCAATLSRLQLLFPCWSLVDIVC